ncbi:MAG TPA: PilZ domain-containing protein [Methylomirabilota bacterium]|jgi:hypothetical protein|nr:PilZ domain-containing protein [Methylomirabilota bacterium]
MLREEPKWLASTAEPEHAAAGDYLRSETRLNSRVPIILEPLEGEQRDRMESKTVDVSPRGCLILLPGRFSVGQAFRLTNRVNQQSTEAQVSWRGQQTPKGWEYGMELLEPPADFWAVEF